MESLKLAMANVLIETEKYLDKEDPQIYALKDYQLILGVTELLWEDQVLKDVTAAAAQINAQAQGAPVIINELQSKKAMSPEEEFDMPEFMDKKKRMLH